MQNSQEPPLPFCFLFVKTQADIDGLDQINEKNLNAASPEAFWNSGLHGLVLKHSLILLLGL